MQGGKNRILPKEPKEVNANWFFLDYHWLEIWKNHLSLCGTKCWERGYGLGAKGCTEGGGGQYTTWGRGGEGLLAGDQPVYSLTPRESGWLLAAFVPGLLGLLPSHHEYGGGGGGGGG